MGLPEPGEIFADKYKLNEVLGQGGFARVYRATQIDIGRQVAIKILRPRRSDPANAARFLREARVLSHLSDPHTVTLHDFGRTEDGAAFMVFEYVEGWTLEDLLQSRGRLKPRVVEHVVRQLLASLREAHDAGILHRDIKPTNIMLHTVRDDPYALKLVDFGIAKSFSDPNVIDVTEEGSIIGTPRYMSPEQLCAEPLGPPSDLHSLGLVAYEMLTGRPALDFESQKDLMKAQLSDTPIALPDDLEVPGPLRQFIDRCLQKEVSSRPSSAAEALALLDAPLEVAAPSAPSGKGLVLGSVALAATIIGVGAFLLFDGPDPEFRDETARRPALDRADTGRSRDSGMASSGRDDAPRPPDLTVMAGQTTSFPHRDIRSVHIEDASLLDWRSFGGRFLLMGKRPGRTTIELRSDDDSERIDVAVVPATDPKAGRAHEIISLFEGASMEFDPGNVRRVSIGDTSIVEPERDDEDSVLTLSARREGTTTVSLVTDEGEKTYVFRVLPQPDVDGAGGEDR